MCIVQLSCVCLWTKGKKDNKQGKNDVSVQCLCNVHSITCCKLGILTPLLNCRCLLKAVSCHHLSAAIVRSIRSTHVRATISNIQISRKVLRCVIPTSVAHLANINRQSDHLCVRRFSKSVLLVSVIAHSSSQCE